MCPACAAAVTTYLLAGTLGSGATAAVALHWRKKRRESASGASPGGTTVAPVPVQRKTGYLDQKPVYYAFSENTRNLTESEVFAHFSGK